MSQLSPMNWLMVYLMIMVLFYILLVFVSNYCYDWKVGCNNYSNFYKKLKW
uniref:ATP synthase F0 subunit 8 n=1 Tax=Sacculina confragosa TaxID=238040 RepID=UPI00255202D6|nr:ATP synthase F0 subunit 8 [Sacculina confragosa]WGU20859.1 ATP synthase F0 subunit 8 [Sacculina confragosa]